MYLSKLASRNGGEDPSVTYADLAAVVQRKDSMEFLHDIVPRKITYGEYLKIMQSEKGKHDDEDVLWTSYYQKNKTCNSHRNRRQLNAIKGELFLFLNV